MKIFTKILLLACFSSFAIIVLTVFLYFSFQFFNQAIEKNRIANQISTSLFERRLLLDEYSLFGEDRPQKQWFVETNNITATIKSNLGLFLKDFEKKDINSILETISLTKKEFSDLLTLRGQNNINSSDIKTIKEQKEIRILAQLINQSQEANDAANRLAVASSAEAVDTQTTILYLWIGYISIILLVMLIGLIIWRRIAMSIVKLHHGTEVIEEGNLDFKVGTPVKDEIGQLSRSFDTMVTKLKVSYLNLENELKVLDESKKNVEVKNKELEDKINELATAREAILNVAEDAEEERQKAEESKAKEGALLQGLGEGVVAIDQNGKVVLINNAAEDMLGLTADQSVGKLITEVRAVLDKDGNSVPIEKHPMFLVLKNKANVMGFSCFYVKRNRVMFPVVVTASSVVLNGKIIGAVEIFRDITKEKEIDKAKTEFVSLASHQLRTPLSAIRWCLEDLDSQEIGKLNKQQKDYIESGLASTKRLIAIVNGLLDVSRLEMGRLTIDPKPTDLVKLVRDTIGEYKKLAEKKKVELKLDKAPTSIPNISIDTMLVRQVVANFISNAIKYARPKTGKSKINVKIEKEGDNVKVLVCDNGEQIPEEYQVHLFSKFYRAPTAAKLDTSGTGLGLYITKLIIENFGGEVIFESREGKGTIFGFLIPLSGSKANKGETTLSI